jgi:glycosyltransferase involved in cell wall biosynthesis
VAELNGRQGAAAPPIAVVVPVYNGAAYLQLCLESLRDQTLTNFEVYVRDDGSRDGSPAIIDRFAADPRFHVLPSTGNLGLFPNVNRLIRASQAPLLRVLCQDDLLEPHCLEEEVAFFAQHPEVGMAYGKVRPIDADGQIIGDWPVEDQPEVMPPWMSMQLFFYHGCIVGNLSNACVRRAVLERLGPFDEGFPIAGDYELWVRICRRYPCGIVRRPILRVRSHKGQLSRSLSAGLASIAESRRVRATILPALPPAMRGYARRYEHLRHDVLDVHFGLRRLAAGDLRTALALARTLGPRHTLLGALCWLLTLDNRLFRPQPRFHPPVEDEQNDPGRALAA